MNRKYLMVLSLITPLANAAINPISQGYDSRIQKVAYNPSNVINIYTRVGEASLIQLEKGEHLASKQLSGIGMGDAGAWGLQVRGNNIFLKPKVVHPDTNLLIVSDKNRTYSFDLKTARNKNQVSYVVKLTYPDNDKIRKSTKYIPCSNGRMNFKYYKWGDNSLSPQYMWDDGQFTCLKFTKNTELPVIYRYSNTNGESLVNYHMDNDVMVIHSVNDNYRLRLGNKVLGLKTDYLNPKGYIPNATSLPNTKRAVIDNE